MGSPGRRAAAGLAAVLLLLLASAWLIPLPARLGLRGSRVLAWEDGTIAHTRLSVDEKWRIPDQSAPVDPRYVEALLALEDSRFFWHPGVDPVAILRAAGQDIAAGAVVSGGSTLTMQLARMMEPRPRNLGSKVVEALRALQLELRLSKEEILASYLSFVPYGRNVEGLHAAALWAFGHDASHLSPAEIATLLAIPQDPNDRFPSPRNADALREARDRAALRLEAAGVFSAEDRASVLQAEVPQALSPIPRRAPHAAAWILGVEDGDRVDTSLDRGVQGLVEARLGAVREELAAKGIHNAAAVVIEHDSGRIRALVGNPDFFDSRHAGQIPAFAEARSPGSALKPFLYALAIDAGLALPGWLVPDVPTAYGGYAPSNYDGAYDGMVGLEEALSRSLNVPMVELLGRFGVESFLGFLRQGGCAHLVPTPGYYGLSAIVGGIELTPLELAGLYAALAEDGLYRSPGWMKEGRSTEAQLFSEGAAWLTREALRRRDRPDFPSRAQLAAVPARIHWKTGTSFGNRDAWAAGSGARYTVVIWLGNLDRTPSAHLVGAEMAAPLLFDVLEGLGDRVGEDPAPKELIEVETCALSGRVPGEACPERVKVLARESRVPSQRCPLHVAAEVDVETGRVAPPGCREGRETRQETFVVWPAAVRRFLGPELAAQPGLPPAVEGCAAPAAGEGPRIKTPRTGDRILMIPGMDPASQEVALEAEALGTLSWFVDGALLASAPAEERVWWVPSPGAHALVVVDEAGRSEERELVVELRR